MCITTSHFPITQGPAPSFYVDEDGFPVSVDEKNPESGRGAPRGLSAGARRKKSQNGKYPTEEIDDRHLYAVSSVD